MRAALELPDFRLDFIVGRVFLVERWAIGQQQVSYRAHGLLLIAHQVVNESLLVVVNLMPIHLPAEKVAVGRMQ